MSSSTFDSTKRGLLELLKQIDSGTMQLPDFQRGWVWDDDRIRSLLASVAVSFPIGAVMLLETGGEGVRFKPRAVEGAPVSAEKQPETLILDGQQRFTSLYQALMLQQPVKTTTVQKKKIERYYYFDMRQMTNGRIDEEDSIYSVPADRVVRSNFGRTIDLDLSTSEKEFENHLFPANLIYSEKEWRKGYQRYWKYKTEYMDLYDEFEEQVIERFKQYQLPVIELKKNTPKEAVCLVFEKVNTGGVSLTVFELLTATFAADNFQLRDDWRDRERRLKQQNALAKLQSDDFLQAISLLVTQAGDQGISCKRRDLLKLTVDDYQLWADRVEAGFRQAAQFLHTQHIYRAKDLPYRTQLVPLAAAFVTLDSDAEPISARQHIARWYWCGVLGELYGGAVESRFARDLPELVTYVRDGYTEPKTVQDANFDANRLLSLRTRNSAAYKGIHALLMQRGCRDFRTGVEINTQTFFDESIDIHHIFPQAWCKKQGISPNRYNSVINKTAISAKTNRIIGGQAPSKYLKKLETDIKQEREQLSAVVHTHGIDADLLYADDFETFFARRAADLVQLIEQAMGKQVAQEGADFLADLPDDDYVDEEEQLDDEDDGVELDAFDDDTDGGTDIDEPLIAAQDAPAPLQKDLEQQFHQAMLDIYRRAAAETGYKPTYFLQMVSELGGLEAARTLLQKTGMSDGFAVFDK